MTIAATLAHPLALTITILRLHALLQAAASAAAAWAVAHAAAVEALAVVGHAVEAAVEDVDKVWRTCFHHVVLHQCFINLLNVFYLTYK